MGYSENIEKLANELSRDITEESQVIAILARTRKVLDFQRGDGEMEKYTALRLYCNWALHVRIDKATPIADLLKDLTDGDDSALVSLLTFKPFHYEFQQFLNENRLPVSIYDKSGCSRKFSKLLSKIYSDTPLFIEKFKIFWIDDPELSDETGSYGGNFRIELV